MSKTASSGPNILLAKEGGQNVNELVQRIIELIGEKLGRPLCQASIFDQTEGAFRIQFCCDLTPRGGGQSRRELVQADISLQTGDVMIQKTNIVLDRPTELFSDPASSIVEIGHYTVDPKGRITIPARFIQQHSCSETRVVLAEGPYYTILAFEMSAWEGLCDAKVGDEHFKRNYLNKSQEVKRSHARTGRVLISEKIRRYARIKFGQELVVLGISGHPGVLLYMPTTHYLKIKEEGPLSLVAQILSFDMIKPVVS